MYRLATGIDMPVFRLPVQRVQLLLFRLLRPAHPAFCPLPDIDADLPLILRVGVLDQIADARRQKYYDNYGDTNR